MNEYYSHDIFKSIKIEFLSYGGYRSEITFKAEWEYDSNNYLTKEINYDVYHDYYVSYIGFYDKKKNIIKEIISSF